MSKIDEKIQEAVTKAGDAYAVLVCRNVGDAAGNITIVDGDGNEGPTQWQNCDEENAIEWAMEGMVGVFIVRSWWDEDKKEWDAHIEEYENK